MAAQGDAVGSVFPDSPDHGSRDGDDHQNQWDSKAKAMLTPVAERGRRGMRGGMKRTRAVRTRKMLVKQRFDNKARSDEGEAEKF